MKPVKYLPLARAIKLFLLLGIALIIIMTVINLSIAIFSLNRSVQVGGGTFQFEDPTDGYKLQTELHLRIPDTLIHYNDGFSHVDRDQPITASSNHFKENRVVREKIVNHIERFGEETDSIRISNQIYGPASVMVKVKSQNWVYNLFWGITAQLNVLFAVLVSLLLLKLTNRYINQTMFENRTFKLIAVLGWLFISREIFNFVISLINGRILEHPQLRSFSALDTKAYNYLTLELDFYKSFSLGNVGVGILIVLLAEIFRVAVIAKKENEMTI